MAKGFESWEDCAGNIGIMSFSFNIVLIISKLKERSTNASTRKINIAQYFNNTRHLYNFIFNFNLLFFQFCVIIHAVPVAEGECGELAGEDHGVGGDVHVPATEIGDHAVDVAATQVQHHEGHYHFVLEISSAVFHESEGYEGHYQRMNELGSVHVELEQEACDNREQMPVESASDHIAQQEPKWVASIHAHHNSDLIYTVYN